MFNTGRLPWLGRGDGPPPPQRGVASRDRGVPAVHQRDSRTPQTGRWRQPACGCGFAGPNRAPTSKVACRPRWDAGPWV